MQIKYVIKSIIRGTVSIDPREGNDGVDEAVDSITDEMVRSGMFNRTLFGYAVRHNTVDSWQLITAPDAVEKITAGMILKEEDGFVVKALYVD